MNRHLILPLLGVMLISTTRVAAAQTRINFELMDQDGRAVLNTNPNDPAFGFDPGKAIVLDRQKSLIVEIACPGAAVDCRQLQLLLVSPANPKGVWPENGVKVEVTSTKGRWEVMASELADVTELKVEDARQRNVFGGRNIAFTTSSDPQRQTGPQGLFSETLNALLTANCLAEAGAISIDPYSAPADRAHFVVTPLGNVLQRPEPIIDENDIVVVIVVGHEALMPALKVRRTSAFRTPGVLNIVGGDTPLAVLSERKAGERDEGPRPYRCIPLKVELSDFKPGRAEIQLSALTQNAEVITGSFEFGVNTLYSGAFSFGAIRTGLKDPEFGVVARPAEMGDDMSADATETVLTEKVDGAPRVLYTLTYTPFIWGKRDLEKESIDRGSLLNLRRLNPMFGIVLNDVDENFVIGLSYDLASAVYLTGGFHFGKVRKLDPEADLNIGDVFTGEETDIPTVREWDWDWFVGMSLDLRAATQFFNKALGVATGN